MAVILGSVDKGYERSLNEELTHIFKNSLSFKLRNIKINAVQKYLFFTAWICKTMQTNSR